MYSETRPQVQCYVWDLATILGTLLRNKKSLLELAYGIANDAFGNRMEQAVEFALEQIKRLDRDLGHRAS